MVEGREIGCQCRGQLWDHGSSAKPTLRYRQTDTQAYMHSHIGIHAFLHTYMYVHLQQPSSLRVKPCPFPVVRLAFHGAHAFPLWDFSPVTVSSRKVLGQEVEQSWAWPFNCTRQAMASSFAGAHVTSTTECVP